MVQAIPIPKGVDPKLTESYLLEIPEVLDASVWWSDGSLFAHVTTIDSGLSERSIQRACLDELGPHQTPRQVTLIAARSFAA